MESGAERLWTPFFMKIKEKIIEILEKNKYEDDFVGPYPYSNEEKAQMIINYLNGEGYRKFKKAS